MPDYSPHLQIAQTRLGVYYVYALNPYENFSDTRSHVPALRSIPITEWVDEDRNALVERFRQYLDPTALGEC